MEKRLSWAVLPVLLLLFVFTPLSIWAQFDGSLTRSLYFATDKADLTAESQKTLGELADSLAQFSSYALHIEGNTDADGSGAYNQKLSSTRVEAARLFLVNRGVPSAAFNKKDALGESKPIADNATDDGKQRNRRVDISVRYRRLPVQESIEKLLSQLENKDQIFTFRAGEDTMFVAEKGTVFQIPANTFDVPNGTIVNFRVRESLTMSDFLKDNLTTTSKNQVLESGGMLRLAADANGKSVNLRKDAAIVVRIPTEKQFADMGYFTGQRNPHDQQMAWTTAPVNQISPMMNGRMSPPANNAWQLERLLTDLAKEEKCTCQLVEKYNYFFDSVKTLPSEDAQRLQEISDLTRKDPSVSEQKLSFWERVRRFFGGSVDEAPVATVKRSKSIKFEERYRIAKNVPYDCQAMAKFAVENRMDKATWQQVHLKYRAGLYLNTRFRFSVYESWVERTPVRTYDALVTRTKVEINFLNKAHIKRMAFYERAKSARQKAFEQAVKNNIINGVASVGDMNAYVFETRALGWINCDRFSSYPPEQMVAMSINLPPQINVDVKLVFKNQKSILPPSVINGKLTFANIPRDEDAILVAFKTENGQPYMAIQDVKTTDVPQTLAFQPTTLALLKERLKGLD
jgi:OmpA family